MQARWARRAHSVGAHSLGEWATRMRKERKRLIKKDESEECAILGNIESGAGVWNDRQQSESTHAAMSVHVEPTDGPTLSQDETTDESKTVRNMSTNGIKLVQIESTGGVTSTWDMSTDGVTLMQAGSKEPTKSSV